MASITAYIGRDNEEKFNILEDNALVTAGTVTRAVLRFSSFCLDTDQHPLLIYFEDEDNQVLCLKIGLVENLRPGTYNNAVLTLFDNINTNGIAWSKISITVLSWPICSS